MNLQELYTLIGLPEDVVGQLNRREGAIDWEKAEPYIAGMMRAQTAAEAYRALRERLGEDEGSFHMLLCQMACACRVYEEYRRRSMPEQVFADTMKCFRRFILECERKTGKRTFDRGWWTYRQLSMTLFRIGELEYELKERDGEKFVSVHIPSGADLSPAAVDESIRQAKGFIERFFPDYAGVKWVCNSWLLSPALEGLLPEGSNIRDFARRFDIVEVDPLDQEGVVWLFEALEGTAIADYPERTRLQRAVKERLLNGEAIGSGYGVMRN